MYIVLEGIDKSGKTTIANWIVNKLNRERQGKDAVYARAPGGTELGDRLYELVLNPQLAKAQSTTDLVFAADYAQLCNEVVQPALDAGRDVVQDRGVPSALAYQYARHTEGWIHALNLRALYAGVPQPDLVICLDISMERWQERGGEADHAYEFIERARAMYGSLPDMAHVDANAPLPTVKRRVWKLVESQSHADRLQQ